MLIIIQVLREVWRGEKHWFREWLRLVKIGSLLYWSGLWRPKNSDNNGLSFVLHIRRKKNAWRKSVESQERIHFTAQRIPSETDQLVVIVSEKSFSYSSSVFSSQFRFLQETITRMLCLPTEIKPWKNYEFSSVVSSICGRELGREGSNDCLFEISIPKLAQSSSSVVVIVQCS